jgi:hypothetical protein
VDARRRRLVGLVAAGAGVAAAVSMIAIVTLTGGERAAETARMRLGGEVVGRAAMRGLAEAPRARRPFRCAARTPTAPGKVVTRGRTWRGDGGRLVGGGRGGRLVLGVVADARGATTETLANLERVTAEFRRAGVDVVVALGGLGTTREEIATVLEALAGERREWLVLALPGDREPVWAFEEALAALAERGVPVVDGARLGVLVADGVAVAALPGLDLDDDLRAHGLTAGADGCGRTDEDADAVARRLAAERGPRVLASYAPPRQTGAGATDLALGGVHVGDPVVTRVARAARVALVVHGQIDEAAGREAPLEAGLAVAAGPLEAAPAPLHGPGGARAIAHGGAVVVEVAAGGRPRVRRVHLP